MASVILRNGLPILKIRASRVDAAGIAPLHFAVSVFVGSQLNPDRFIRIQRRVGNSWLTHDEIGRMVDTLPRRPLQAVPGVATSKCTSPSVVKFLVA